MSPMAASIPDLVSVNGPDNAGKTTHLRRLSKTWAGFETLGSVHHHNPQPWAQASAGDYYAWWFREMATAALTRLLLESDTARAKARSAGRVGLLDRGRPMMQAVAAATCAVKDQLPVPAALRLVEAIESSYPRPPVETAVLLLPSLDTEKSLAITSAREDRPWTGLYPAYQRALHRVLLLQRERGDYAYTVIAESRDLDAVHVDVSTALRTAGYPLP